jgi:hypothetical protein
MLVFTLFKSPSETAKALACISVIEASSEDSGNLLQTVQYAKFKIYLKDCNLEQAQGALWSILKMPLTSFDVALDAVKCLDDADVDVVPFYKHIATKYPK